MLLGRLQKGRLSHTTPLYNTALDICGHQGMLLEAGRILHQMVARNVRSDERTISSLLNAIAEYCVKLQRGQRGTGEGRSRGRAGSKSVSDLGPGTETDGATAISAVSPQPSTLVPGAGAPLNDLSFGGGSGSSSNNMLPSLDAFQVRSLDEAVELAIRLYTSWIRYTRDRAPAPFNNLLKVVAVTGRRDLLTALFPLERAGGLATNWVPRKPDQVTYTIAISAAGADFCLARSYWDAFLDRHQHGQPGGAGMAPVNVHMIKAITWSLLLHVTEGGASRGRADGGARPGEVSFLHCLLDLVTGSTQSIQSVPPIKEDRSRPRAHAQSQAPVPVQLQFPPLLTSDISSNIMHLCARLRMASQGVDFWQGTLFPLLQRQGSFRKVAGTFDQRTIVALCELYVEVRGEPGEALALVERLQGQFEMRLTDPDLLTVLLLAHRRLGDADGAERLFRQHCRRLSPDHRIIQQLLMAIHGDGRTDRTERRVRLAAWLRWLRETDAIVYNRTVSIPRLQPILKDLE